MQGVDQRFSLFKRTGESLLAETKWLRLKTVAYTDADGQERKWDVAERTTRVDDHDGVDIVAILKGSAREEDRILLVAQYRAPCDRVVIELPAGLTDPGESASETALRELQEECGYSGAVTAVSPLCVLEPGMSNAATRIVTVEVDASSVSAQQLDDEECIQVLSVPLASLCGALHEFSQQGCLVDAKLYCLAAFADLIPRKA
eukprot:CAMPEP_0177634138 /NCGR_PEP_ID=MMETSP0447-20121125/3210_1 /TAXON_ID=0 /ORGANISM="Stygamoeba regulata, Strain BSH-02190019" /LENGTH=202 /DNA_ID=CAMNT_0019135843 /DNA_START=105 /DNA_END=713 /DNA_ORIENTATION=+